MNEQKYIVISLLKEIFGEPKSSNNSEERTQWEFNCQSDYCRNDVNKFNLSFNSEHNIFKCWKCGESGFVHKLVRKYGSKEQFKKLITFIPAYNNKNLGIFQHKINTNLSLTCPLPEGFTPLNTTIQTKMHELAYDYIVNKRKITPQEIDYYQIGYTEVGAYRNRVIIPSFNKNKDVNYFEARSFLENVKMTYYKPDKKNFKNKNVPNKFDIIFNEYNINWDLPIYLVEGVFDMFRIPNSIPMLGKTLSWLLILKLIEHQSKIIICLDGDAFKDSIKIYKELDSLGLDTYILDLRNKNDISNVYERTGRKGIIDLLKNPIKLNINFELAQILK